MNYYIQGNEDKADQIKAAFRELGYNTRGFDFSCGFFYTVEIYVHYCVSDYMVNIIKTHPNYKELELPVEPKFKVGDKIKTGSTIETIAEIGYATRSYYCESGRTISFENQDLWHLAPKPHYDIKNFKPFDKVLARDTENEKWVASLFSNYDEKDCIPHHFICIDSCYTQCIPFEGNEHLLGTTDMCDKYYINW